MTSLVCCTGICFLWTPALIVSLSVARLYNGPSDGLWLQCVNKVFSNTHTVVVCNVVSSPWNSPIAKIFKTSCVIHNFMEQSYSWAADSRAASQEIPSFFYGTRRSITMLIFLSRNQTKLSTLTSYPFSVLFSYFCLSSICSEENYW
jgi:hypothetical protein